jgi:hypothetical protein
VVRVAPNSPDLFKPDGRHVLGLNTTDLVGRLQPMSEIGRIQFSLFFSADYDINHDGLRKRKGEVYGMYKINSATTEMLPGSCGLK